MEKMDLSDGAIVREFRDGVIVGYPDRYTDKEIISLNREQVAALWTWLNGWMREQIAKGRKEGE